jgi:Tfp pilus assembly protein PilO
MSRFGRVDRLWMVGGVLGAAVLLAITWFLLVTPQHEERDNLKESVQVTQRQLGQLQQRLGKLQEEYAKLPQYKAELAKAQQALPSTPALSDLLRELQRAGDATTVTVSGLNVGNLTPLTTNGGQVYTLALSLTASGPIDKLNAFLDQLQQVQPRALLISTASLSRTTATSTTASLSLTLTAFVSPASATPSPSPSTSPSPSPSSSPSTSPSR